MEGMEVKRFYFGILGWGVFLTVVSLGGLLVPRPSLLNGLLNPWAVSTVMLAGGGLMILDFFLSHFSKKERFGLTLLTLLANLAYYLCSAIVTAGTGFHSIYAAVRFGLGILLSAAFGWATWYFCRHKNRHTVIQE